MGSKLMGPNGPCYELNVVIHICTVLSPKEKSGRHVSSTVHTNQLLLFYFCFDQQSVTSLLLLINLSFTVSNI